MFFPFGMTNFQGRFAVSFREGILRFCHYFLSHNWLKDPNWSICTMAIGWNGGCWGTAPEPIVFRWSYEILKNGLEYMGTCGYSYNPPQKKHQEHQQTHFCRSFCSGISRKILPPKKPFRCLVFCTTPGMTMSDWFDRWPPSFHLLPHPPYSPDLPDLTNLTAWVGWRKSFWTWMIHTWIF